MTKNSSAIKAAVQTFLAVQTSNPSMKLPRIDDEIRRFERAGDIGQYKARAKADTRAVSAMPPMSLAADDN
jgi:hypothetical protein